MKNYLLITLILLSGCAVKRPPCTENCAEQTAEQTQEEEIAEEEEEEEEEESVLQFQANDQSETATVSSGERVLLSWGGGGFEDCLITPGDLTGESGTFLTEPLTETVIYEILCQKEDGTVGTALLNVIVE